MKTKNFKGILFVTLLILLVGIVSASDIDNSTQTDTIVKESVKDIDTAYTVNEIRKKEVKTVKSNQQSITETIVDNNDTLLSEIDKAKNSTSNNYVINLKTKEYNVTKGIYINCEAKDKILTINGNGSTLNGKKNIFLNVSKTYNIVLRNIIFNGFGNESGGVITSHNVLLDNCTFTNNYAKYKYNDYRKGGSVIFGNNLTIKNSIFRENTMNSGYGAVVYGDNIKISNCLFTGNIMRGGYGGAIGGSNINITNTVLNNNIVYNGKGGAIYGDYITLNNCTLTNNAALSTFQEDRQNDGVIFDVDFGDAGEAAIYGNYISVNNSVFTKHHLYASFITSVLIRGNNLKICSSNFTDNYIEIPSTIRYETDADGKTIPINYTTDDSLIQSSTIVGENITISDSILKNENNLILQELEGNNISVTNSQLKNDMICLTQQDKEVNCLELNNYTTINSINIYYPFKQDYYSTLKITLKDNSNNILSNHKITISINNKNITKLSNSKGQIAISLNESCQIKIFKDNTESNGVSISNLVIEQKSKKETSIENFTIKDLYEYDKYVISGKYVDNNTKTGLKNYQFTVQGQYGLNKIILTTDENGNFNETFKNNYKFTEFRIDFNATNEYKSYSTKFNLKKRVSTTIDIDKSNDTVYGEKVTVKGTLYKLHYYDKGLASQKLIININNKNYTCTTNSSGEFLLTYNIQDYKNQNVTVVYPGNTDYYSSIREYSFKVKENTKITYYKIGEKTTNSTIKISGKLLDSKNKPIQGKNVIINVNSKNFTAKTYSSGYFTINYKVTKIGLNNVIFTFNGSADYNTSKNTTVFTARQKTKIILYKIANQKYGNTIKISGKLLTLDNKAVKGENVTINIQGNKYVVKTYSSGYFTTNYKVASYKDHKITFVHSKSQTSLYSKNSTSFKVKKVTTMTVYKLSKTKKSKTIKISGKLLSNNKGVKGVTVTIKVNNKKYAAKTYSSGYFTINYKTTSVGKNNVTYTFPGNNEYLSCTKNTKFTVTK